MAVFTATFDVSSSGTIEVREISGGGRNCVGGLYLFKPSFRVKCLVGCVSKILLSGFILPLTVHLCFVVIAVNVNWYVLRVTLSPLEVASSLPPVQRPFKYQ